MRDEDNLNECLEIAHNAHAEFDRAIQVAKNSFLQKYDKSMINGLLETLADKHTSEEKFAKEFAKAYQSDNYDDAMMLEFDRLYKKYYNDVLKVLDGKENNI